MDKPSTSQVEGGTQPDSQTGQGGFGRKMVIWVFVFWVAVVVIYFIARYPFIFSQLIGGGEDRALLAIESAEVQDGVLDIEFIRSQPDQPVGVFVVSGHIPQMALRTTDPGKENKLAGSDLTINGQTYEIIFEASDSSRLPGRQDSLAIDWLDKEHGRISLDLAGTYALEEIQANRAFLVVARDAADFRAASIMHD